MEVIVGVAGEASTIVTNDQTVLSAAAGEDYQGYRGGAGYSGGGGGGTSSSSPGADGGENGRESEDGFGGSGGDGSGFDVSAVRLDNFILTVGKAGAHRFQTRGYFSSR